MNKKHKLLTILLILVMCLTLTMSLIACDTDNTGDTDEVTDSSKYITNGNFEIVTSDSFPKTPGSWTGSAGSTSSDNETKTDEKSLIAGVIDTDSNVYDKNKRTWGKLSNPGKTGEDNNILMIYNKIDNSYKYTSSSFSLDANKYFRISVDVKTVDISGAGVFVGISGDFYHEFIVKDTQSEWTTVNFYIQTSNISSNSFSIVLSNGRYGANDGKLSKGYALFDNVLVTEIESIENGQSAKEQFDAVAESETVVKESLILGDSSFKNVGGKENPYTPNKWSGVSSVGDNGTAPTGSDYLEKGIYNLNETRPDSVPAGLNPIGKDNNVLFINNKQKTAYGYRADKKIRFESNKYYKLTINVATFLDTDITGQGAYIRLMNSTDKDDEVVVVNGINTNGEWKEISIYIKADPRRNKDLYFELGLGTGGKNDTTLIKGQAFFDEMTLTTYNTEEEFKQNQAIVAGISNTTDLTGTIGDNMITNGTFDNGTEGWTTGDYDKNDGITSRGNHQTLDTSNTNWDTALYGANPKTPSDIISNVLMINNTNPTLTKIKLANNKTIDRNGYYRIGLWVKTSDIKEGLGLNASLYEYKGNEWNEADRKNKLASFDNINTDTIKPDEYNGYVELVFYIEGDALKDKEVYLELSLGSGTFFTAQTLVSGRAFITDVSMYKVAYSEYTSESGSYIKKHSFKTSNATITNGNFDNVNIQETIKQYDNIKEEKDIFNDDGTLKTFALPKDWTSSDKSLLSQLNAGIMTPNNTLLGLLNAENNNALSVDNFYEGFKLDGKNNLTVQENPNVMAISTKEASNDYKLTEATKPEICGCDCQTCIANGYCDGTKCDECDCAHKGYDGTIAKPWGFTSPSFTMSKNSYYLVSVWVRLVNGNDANVLLKTSSKSVVSKHSITSIGIWERYDFYIETGFDDVKANLEIALGSDDNSNISGTVLFDMPNMISIDEDIYKVAVKESQNSGSRINTLTYTTTTFDNVTVNEDKLDSPTGWTGENKDSESPNGDTKQVAGVFNRDHSNRDWFGIEGEEDTIISNEDLNKFLNDSIFGRGVDNDNVLVINNKEASEYTFSTTLAKSLPSKSYYEISVYVLTHKLADDKTATISLKLNNLSYTFSKNADKNINVNTGDTWRKYSFYIATPETKSIDSVTLSLALGQKDEDNFVAGYAFFDNVTVAKITEDDFNAAVPEETFDASVNHRIVFTDDDVNKPEPTEEDNKNPLLWLYITSGILGAIIVIVVIVVLFKKFYKPTKKTNFKSNKGKETYNRNKTDSNASSNNKIKDINKKYKE